MIMREDTGLKRDMNQRMKDSFLNWAEESASYFTGSGEPLNCFAQRSFIPVCLF